MKEHSSALSLLQLCAAMGTSTCCHSRATRPYRAARARPLDESTSPTPRDSATTRTERLAWSPQYGREPPLFWP